MQQPHSRCMSCCFCCCCFSCCCCCCFCCCCFCCCCSSLRYLKLSHVIQILHRDKRSKRRRSRGDGMQFPGKRKQMLMLTLKLKGLPSSYFCFLLLPSSPRPERLLALNALRALKSPVIYLKKSEQNWQKRFLANSLLSSVVASSRD